MTSVAAYEVTRIDSDYFIDAEWDRPTRLCPPDSLTAARSLRKFEVQVVGNQVTVTQAVEIMDKRPGMLYFWDLVIRHPTDPTQVYLERPRFDQAFTVPNRNARPTVTETATLPPGQYMIEMRLYEWGPNTPAARFQDATFARGQQSVTGKKVITIPPAS